MTNIVFCILNYFNDKEFLQIKSELEFVSFSRKEPDEYLHIIPQVKKIHLKVNGIDLYYFLKEILQWTNYRRILLKSSPSRTKFFVIKVIPPEKEALDYKWNQIVSHTIWEKVETDNLISWLSTLGGGFSALGETFIHHAEIAGKISLKQLTIGLKLGDPFLQARCKLFYSISLIQTGKLRLAKYIIREQYKFAFAQKEFDQKLVNMCEGIWLKLQYAYSLRHNKNSKAKINVAKNVKCDNKVL